MRQFTLNLNPGDSIPLTVKGRYLRVLTAGGNVTVTIGGGAPHVLAQGIGLDLPEGFDLLRVDSAIAQTVVIEAGFGRVDDGRLSVSAPVSITKAATMRISNVQWADAVAHQLVAANAARRELIIVNQNDLGTNAQIFIGPDNTVGNVGAPMGVKLAPGEKIVLSTSAAVWAIEPTAAGANNIICLSIED